MRRAILLLAMLALTACESSKPAHMETGDDVDPPNGWVHFCEMNPDSPNCVVPE